MNDKLCRVKTHCSHFVIKCLSRELRPLPSGKRNSPKWEINLSKATLLTSPGSRLTVAKTKKTQTLKSNKALVLAFASFNLTIALTNVKAISIMLNQARNPRKLSALGVVIMLAPHTHGTPATKKITYTLTLISQQFCGFRV